MFNYYYISSVYKLRPAGKLSRVVSELVIRTNCVLWLSQLSHENIMTHTFLIIIYFALEKIRRRAHHRQDVKGKISSYHIFMESIFILYICLTIITYRREDFELFRSFKYSRICNYLNYSVSTTILRITPCLAPLHGKEVWLH